jgi:hypothetical protein
MTATAATGKTVRVVLEVGAKRSFASALDWPGWSRSGKDEDAALDALAEHAQRYAEVAGEAGLRLHGGDLVVVERVPGDATTDFGAPSRPASEESAPLKAADARRVTALVGAAWRVFDAVVADAPATLRKGPRGGGRDRDAIVDHVLGAEHAYARKLGVRLPQPRGGDTAAIRAKREAIIAALDATMTRQAAAGSGWAPRYAARRIAWHVVDHAWEIENRTER